MKPAELGKRLLAGQWDGHPVWEVNAGVQWLCDTIADHAENAVRNACAVLNSETQFAPCIRLAQTWRDRRGFDATICKHQAQALIDLNALDDGDALLCSALESVAGAGSSLQAKMEWLEFKGLQARIYKQRFVQTRDADMLGKAYAAYLYQYENHPDQPYWFGVNAMALLARARQERIPLESTASVASLAASLLVQLEPDGEEGDPWACASLSEVFLALGDYHQAELWLYRLIHHSESCRFQLESYGRQLREIWRGSPLTGRRRGADKLAAIVAAYQAKMSHSLTLSHAQAQEMQRMSNADLEQNFSAAGTFSVQTIRQMLDVCTSIGCVGNGTGARLGTGFLVHASHIGGAEEDGMYFVTNAHVLSETVDHAIRPADAWVSFELGPQNNGLPKPYKVGRIVYSSPPGPLGEQCHPAQKLDVTVATLKDLPVELQGLKTASRIPLVNGKSRVYVIGHPRGSGLQISLHDSLLLARDEHDRLLHYRTPTDPGNSGSPVFNEDWRVIALHHGGSASTPRLRPDTGVYEANEGILLNAIKGGLNVFAGAPACKQEVSTQ